MRDGENGQVEIQEEKDEVADEADNPGHLLLFDGIALKDASGVHTMNLELSIAE